MFCNANHACAGLGSALLFCNASDACTGWCLSALTRLRRRCRASASRAPTTARASAGATRPGAKSQALNPKPHALRPTPYSLLPTPYSLNLTARGLGLERPAQVPRTHRLVLVRVRKDGRARCSCSRSHARACTAACHYLGISGSQCGCRFRTRVGWACLHASWLHCLPRAPCSAGGATRACV